MSKVRGFEKVSKEQYMKDFKSTFPIENGSASEEEINDIINSIYTLIKLPKRETKLSAGYDCYAPITFELKPQEEIKIPTGIKAYMQPGEVLFAFPRSGLGFKYYCRLANTIGVIDGDYIESDNEGHIFVKLRNEGTKDMHIEADTAICQFIFMPFLLIDVDSFDKGEQRNGGFGSTDK